MNHLRIGHYLVIFALCLSLLLCAACSAPTENDPVPEAGTTAPQPSVPEDTPENQTTTDPQPEQPEDAGQSSQSEAQPADAELLRLVEMFDAERPQYTPFVSEKAADDTGVKFTVEFCTQDGWLAYAAKSYTASFNDDGWHLTDAEVLFESEAPCLSTQAIDAQALLPLAQRLEFYGARKLSHFRSAQELSSDDLYDAYLLLASEEELQDRYNSNEQRYFIYYRHIVDVLDRHFAGYVFDDTLCSDYDETLEGIVVETAAPFDEHPYLKAVSAEVIDGQAVTLTTEVFADEACTVSTGLKAYTIEFHEGGWRYRSVLDLPADGSDDPTAAALLTMLHRAPVQKPDGKPMPAKYLRTLPQYAEAFGALKTYFTENAASYEAAAADIASSMQLCWADGELTCAVVDAAGSALAQIRYQPDAGVELVD